MKKVYKYIKFEQDELKRWFCYNKKNDDWEMAEITYKTQWNQWVVEFRVGYIFNNTCLNDISHFLTQLNKPASSPPKEQGEGKKQAEIEQDRHD